jgi:hypothetical protein
MGGTSSATRTIGLAYFLGYSDITLIGFDSSVEGTPDVSETLEDGRPKYIQVVLSEKPNKETQSRLCRWAEEEKRNLREGDTQPIWTTPELAAQIQDMEMFLRDKSNGLKFNVLTEGAVGELWKRIQRSEPRKDSIEDVLKGLKRTDPTTDAITDALNTIDKVDELNRKDLTSMQGDDKV